MASSSSSSSSFSALNCIALVIILLLSFDIIRATRPVETNPMLKLCSRTRYPDTCTECISLEDSSAADYDLRSMIGDVLYCAYNNAIFAFEESQTLVDDCSQSRKCKNEHAVINCNTTIFYASQHFLAAYKVIKSKDLSEIQTDLLRARSRLNNCPYQQDAQDFPQKMIDELETTKHLQEIATSLCQLAPTVSVQT